MSKVFYTYNTCSQCGKKIALDKKFCSNECKFLSQIKRIKTFCSGCGKKISIRLYLKRKTNYCSNNCYWNSNRLKKKKTCKICGKEFLIKFYLAKKGFGSYCSRKCQFKDYPERTNKICPQCGRKFEVRLSIKNLRKFCSEKCRDDSARDYVFKICRKCGRKFGIPRSDLNRGKGKFCTYRCFLSYRGPSTLEEKMERVLNLAGIKFEREIKFKRYHVDFLVRSSKTAIECDGEYWHLNPKMRERDKRKDVLLKSLGYKVLRFPGKTINKLTEKQLSNRIVDALFLKFPKFLQNLRIC